LVGRCWLELLAIEWDYVCRMQPSLATVSPAFAVRAPGDRIRENGPRVVAFDGLAA
jgi:hypothetical protein